MTLDNPYSDLPDQAFWRSGVATANPFQCASLYQKKWDIGQEESIAAAGSCFAQHISRYLKLYGYRLIDQEPAPPGLPDAVKRKHGFNMYSARYGNIYTARQLLQLAKEASGQYEPAEIVWERDGRFFDAHRPAVEPDGLDTPEEVHLHRKQHLHKVQEMFKQMDVFIFTLGLTEVWSHKETGTVFPTAPGTIAGTYDENRYEFRNLQFQEILSDLIEFDELIGKLRPTGVGPRYIFTVSPVPLTGTYTGKHVLAATTYSKSVLRAVAGQLEHDFDRMDYFPSFEIITNPAARQMFFETNLRSVRNEGVKTVMDAFFSQHAPQSAQTAAASDAESASSDRSQELDAFEDEVQCEEAALEAMRA